MNDKYLYIEKLEEDGMVWHFIKVYSIVEYEWIIKQPADKWRGNIRNDKALFHLSDDLYTWFVLSN